MATHSSILAWRIPGTEEPSGLPSMGSHRVGHDGSDLAAAAAAAAAADRQTECLKNYGGRFATLYRRQRSRPSPRKRNGCLRRPYK